MFYSALDPSVPMADIFKGAQTAKMYRKKKFKNAGLIDKRRWRVAPFICRKWHPDTEPEEVREQNRKNNVKSQKVKFINKHLQEGVPPEEAEAAWEAKGNTRLQFADGLEQFKAVLRSGVREFTSWFGSKERSDIGRPVVHPNARQQPHPLPFKMPLRGRP